MANKKKTTTKKYETRDGTNPEVTKEQNWIRSSESIAKKSHWNNCRDAWREYLNTVVHNAAADALGYVGPKRYPIFWSSVRTIQSAYYSKTPKVIARRQFDVDDPIARTACVIYERAARYWMRNSPYDTTMYSARDEYILCDKATVKVCHEHEEEEREERKKLIRAKKEDGSPLFINEDGEEVSDGVETDEKTGDTYYNSTGTYVTKRKILLAPVSYDEILVTPYARDWSEVDKIAFPIICSKADFRNRFPNAPQDITFSSYSSQKRDKDDEGGDTAIKGSNTVELFTTYYEVWNIKTKTVCCVSLFSDEYLEEPKPDPFKLIGFFPVAPFILGTKPRDSMFPTPMYTQLKPTIEQLHKLYNKIFNLITAIRRRAIADASLEDVAAAINGAQDNEVIISKGFKDLVEKGGLQNAIQYLPVAELVSAISELEQLTDKFKNEFYEFTGVPDVIRGASDPIETATAQTTKAKHAGIRFQTEIRKMEGLARDGIELMLDLCFSKCSDDEIMDIAGYDHLDANDQQNFFESLALLRDDDARMIRIDVETDSTSDMADDQAERNAVTQTVMTGLEKVAAIAQSAPAFTGAALKALLFALRGFSNGKAFEDEVQQAVGALMDQADQPPPPPPPNPDLVKAQAQIQVATVQAQADMAINNAKVQAEMVRDQQRFEHEAALENADASHQQQLKNLEAQLAQYKAELDRIYLDNEAALSAQKLEVERQFKILELQMKQENARVDQEIKLQEALAKSQKPPDIIVNVQPAAKKRRMVVQTDPVTGARSYVAEDVEAEPIL